MAQINPRLLVQSLTETRGRILWAYLFAGKAMDVKELSTWTGKPRNAHYADLAILCAAGLLARSSQKMAHGKDVYLLGSEVLPVLRELAGQISAGKYLDEEPVELINFGQVPALETPRRLPASVQYQERGVTFELNLAACRRQNIGEPAATEISLLEWASPDFVKAHVDSLYRGDTIGLAILRIRNNEIPRLWEEEAQEIAKKQHPRTYEVIDDDEREGD